MHVEAVNLLLAEVYIFCTFPARQLARKHTRRFVGHSVEDRIGFCESFSKQVCDSEIACIVQWLSWLACSSCTDPSPLEVNLSK